MPKIPKNARETKKRKTKNQKNEIQPEANVNKVQGDVCFCQKKKTEKRRAKKTLNTLICPVPIHSRVLSVACPA